MKKFLIIFLVSFGILGLFDYLYFFNGDYYIPKRIEPSYISSSKENKLYIDQGNGNEVFDIKGVNLGLGKPGHFATEFSITKEEYLRWFQQIQELGANVIRTYTVAHPEFYEAFYEYNKDNKNPLYLIHGVWVDDYLINSSYSALDEEFYEPFLEDCKDVVDVIHGRFKKKNENTFLPWNYKYDISPWVYGYILGIEWEGDIVALTNDSEKQLPQFKGEYLHTEDARNFEIFLAAIGDETIKYETEKYANQHAVAFANWPTTCPLDFPENVRLANKKYAQVDVDNIRPNNNFKAGMFASYHIYPYYPEYVLFEDPTIKNSYYEYLKRLNDYHDIPVVISEFGVPSSRGMASYEANKELGRNQGKMSEKDQGKAVVSLYKDIMDAGSAGGIVFIWQDEWFKRTWNTIPTVDLENVVYWSDVQTNEQFFGLLSFDPGKKKSICYVDGDKSEWKKKDEVINNNNLSLSMKYDNKYMYFMVEKRNLKFEEDHLYIPIDITPKSGSKFSENLKLRMNRDADFIIDINKKEESRIWVHERYDTTRALYGNQLKHSFNQYVSKPKVDSTTFDPIQMILHELNYYNRENKISFQEFNYNDLSHYYTLVQTYETGKLTYGNANPESQDFNSIADFYNGKDCIEIRIPWGLLNFADPTNMMIHDDYYENYGVEYIPIKQMYVGVGDGSKEIQMEPFELEKMDKNPEYHERLKESYYILKEYWNK